MVKHTQILFLLHIPPPVHGSSVVGLMIKESLSINSSFKCHYINLLSSNNIKESGKVNFNKLLGFLFVWLKVLMIIIIKRPKLCYMALSTTGTAFFKDMLLVALLKIFRIKRIYHLHNKGVDIYQYKTIYRFCYNFVFRNAEIILLSKLLYADIQAFVPLTKVHICPNGIPAILLNYEDSTLPIGRQITNSTPQSLEKKQLDNSNKLVNILFLSNLYISKGVYTLLDACYLLKEKNIQFKCIFVGGESEITSSRFYEHVNQLKLMHEVTYLGEKHGIDKYKIFSDSDIFVFPTHYETFGLVNLEAMQHSKPIISTIEGAIPDIIEDGINGFLVPKMDKIALANKLEILINNPELCYKMGAAGRKKYEQEFTFDKFESRIIEILKQVVNN
jgi:glycosyltransferase involved in cell wall biosynthesis